MVLDSLVGLVCWENLKILNPLIVPWLKRRRRLVVWSLLKLWASLMIILIGLVKLVVIGLLLVCRFALLTLIVKVV